MVGKIISHYKIIEKIGQGGVGVVYRAIDLRLDRTVALKFLHPHFAADEEGRRRFIREAKAAAAIDHPNICTVYEIGETESGIFIAMAFLDGETLAKKIAAGPLKLHDALQLAVQLADVLEAAHEKEIVHRDIKPSNIMVTKKGLAKVMDFGLAQFTLQTRLTKAGTILGTCAYMSPEQTEARAVDNRTDIWSLGVVLYEMITGQRPFGGKHEQAIVYSILNEEPEPITALRAGVPMELEWIVRKALSVDLEDRYRRAEELRVDLRSLDKRLSSSARQTSWAGGVTTGGQTLQASSGLAAIETRSTALAHPPWHLPEDQDNVASVLEQAQRRERRTRIALITTLAALLVTIGVLFWRTSNSAVATSEAPLRRFIFTPSEDVDGAVISPNGRYIVYLVGLMTTAARGLPSGAETSLWIRDLERPDVRPIANSENASFPFWSPDSEFIGFRAGRELRKISVRGGPAVTLCRLPSQAAGGGTWSPDGKSIIFSSFNPPGLYEVSAAGGKASLLMEQASEGEILASPSMLPLKAGRRALLFGRGSQTSREIVLHDFQAGKSIVLGRGAFPVYSSSGHIIFQTGPRTAGLWALPFSLERLQPGGEAFPIAQYARGPSVAEDRTLVYVSDPATAAQQLVWRDREGRRLGRIGRPQARIVDPTLSSDGRHVAVRGWENRYAGSDIWIHDTVQSVKNRLTFEEEDETAPLWTPDGEEITYVSRSSGNLDIITRAVDGRSPARKLVAGAQNEYADDWSRDGKYFIYTSAAEETHLDLWYLERENGSEKYRQTVFLQTPSRELAGKLSPNGRYLAFVSDESGRYEVYVQPFPQGRGKWQVSLNGGGQPRWRGDGKELFYVEHTTLMSVPVKAKPRFSFGSAAPLFEDENLLHRFPTPIYDVSADGQRFVLIEAVGPDQDSRASIHVVQNWFMEFAPRPNRGGS